MPTVASKTLYNKYVEVLSRNAPVALAETKPTHNDVLSNQPHSALVIGSE